MIDVQKYGPWAIIPGGSEGVDACIARRLAAAGVNLVLLARKPDPLDELARELESAKVEVRTLTIDLTRDDMLDEVRKVTDDIDVGFLAYNAGAAHRTGPFLETPLADALKIIRLNTIGHVTLAHHFGERMAKRGAGGIAVIGSMGGNAGSPSVVTYGGTKAFAQNFCEGLWWELRPQGVDVLYMVVGPTNTPAMERLGITYFEGAVSSDKVARHTLENIAKGPVFVMPELVEAYTALCTPDRRTAAEINGANVTRNTDTVEN